MRWSSSRPKPAAIVCHWASVGRTRWRQRVEVTFDLVEAVPEALSDEDEGEAADRRTVESAVAARRSLGSNQSLVLVEADGRGGQPVLLATAPIVSSASMIFFEECLTSTLL